MECTYKIQELVLNTVKIIMNNYDKENSNENLEYNYYNSLIKLKELLYNNISSSFLEHKKNSVKN
jgi:hypothetical protein